MRSNISPRHPLRAALRGRCPPWRRPRRRSWSGTATAAARRPPSRRWSTSSTRRNAGKIKATTLAVPYDAFADKITAAVPRGKGPDVFIFVLPVSPGRWQDRIGGGREGAPNQPPLMDLIVPKGGRTQEQVIADFSPRDKRNVVVTEWRRRASRLIASFAISAQAPRSTTWPAPAARARVSTAIAAARSWRAVPVESKTVISSAVTPGPCAGHDLGRSAWTCSAVIRPAAIACWSSPARRTARARRPPGSAGDEAGIELLLAVIVRTDGGDERPRPYVLEAEEVGASRRAGGADIGAGERRRQIRRRAHIDARKLRRQLGRQPFGAARIEVPEQDLRDRQDTTEGAHVHRSLPAAAADREGGRVGASEMPCGQGARGRRPQGGDHHRVEERQEAAAGAVEERQHALDRRQLETLRVGREIGVQLDGDPGLGTQQPGAFDVQAAVRRRQSQHPRRRRLAGSVRRRTSSTAAMHVGRSSSAATSLAVKRRVPAVWTPASMEPLRGSEPRVSSSFHLLRSQQSFLNSVSPVTIKWAAAVGSLRKDPGMRTGQLTRNDRMRHNRAVPLRQPTRRRPSPPCRCRDAAVALAGSACPGSSTMSTRREEWSGSAMALVHGHEHGEGVPDHEHHLLPSPPFRPDPPRDLQAPAIASLATPEAGHLRSPAPGLWRDRTGLSGSSPPRLHLLCTLLI